MKHLPIAGLLLLSLAACSRSPDSPEAAPAPAKDTATATAPADADLATTSPVDPRSATPAAQTPATRRYMADLSAQAVLDMIAANQGHLR